MTTAQQYKIIKDQWIKDGIDCEHSMCERFHKNGCPEITVTEWWIMDTKTLDRANINDGMTYDTKREAVAVLNRFLEKEGM